MCTPTNISGPVYKSLCPLEGGGDRSPEDTFSATAKSHSAERNGRGENFYRTGKHV